MNPERLLTETATITTRTPVTVDGEPVRDGFGVVQVAESTRDVACHHEQTARDENSPIAVETWDLYLPRGDPLTATAKVTIDGIDFEVIGPPWQTRNPRTEELAQVQATLRRTDG